MHVNAVKISQQPFFHHNDYKLLKKRKMCNMPILRLSTSNLKTPFQSKDSYSFYVEQMKLHHY